MHIIIEHYGKVIVALASVLATILVVTVVVAIVSAKTTSAVENIQYESLIYEAIGETQTPTE